MAGDVQHKATPDADDTAAEKGGGPFPGFELGKTGLPGDGHRDERSPHRDPPDHIPGLPPRRSRHRPASSSKDLRVATTSINAAKPIRSFLRLFCGSAFICFPHYVLPTR